MSETHGKARPLKAIGEVSALAEVAAEASHKEAAASGRLGDGAARAP